MSTTASKKPKAAAAPKAAPRSSAPKAKTVAAKPAPKIAPVSPVTGSAPKPAPSAQPAVVDAPKSVILGPELRKKELIDDVVARSGIKKKDAKPVVEATLAALGDALAEKRELVLPPLGKLKVRREKDMPNARVFTAKIRQSKAH
ncbi:HU family DNA-binding protein [uncultured Sulfitobacter sp.]|uniref:HU family DNA-binding protein n=1 Tax=uncultured Sulfitobacter sp. TaxID=191468 RepID=UPI002626C5C4|nr:HU family DNA-binding protein [uncultured Sulfitobacter sp.]